jgi:hypothetical protein
MGGERCLLRSPAWHGAPMRVLSLLISSVFAFACGRTDTPDASVVLDAGMSPGDGGMSPEDAGFIAPPLCLPDVEDAGFPRDAGLDFSCRGRSPAPGGQAQLLITGKTTRAGFTRTALQYVQLDLLSATGDVLAVALSNDAGVYRLSFDAGCAPLDGEVRATHPPSDAGFAISYSVPGAPWRSDRSNLELVMFDKSTSDLAAAIAGVTITPGTAVLALTVEDCAGKPVPGAVVSTVSGAGDVRYVGIAGLPINSLQATVASGDVVLFNLPGQSVEVRATLDGGVIGQRVVPIHADSPSGTFLSP